MGGKGMKKKDVFEDLDSEYKDAVAAMSVEDIKKRIAQVAMNEEENQKLKGEDQDLQQKKEEAAEAGKVYKESTKMNRLRIQFAMRVIGDKGAA